MTNHTDTPQSIAAPRIPAGLTKKPFAVTTFSDLKRGKDFVTLRYRVRQVNWRTAFAFIEDVTSDIARANVPQAGPLQITLTPTERGWTVHMDVPIGERG